MGSNQSEESKYLQALVKNCLLRRKAQIDIVPYPGLQSTPPTLDEYGQALPRELGKDGSALSFHWGKFPFDRGILPMSNDLTLLSGGLLHSDDVLCTSTLSSYVAFDSRGDICPVQCEGCSPRVGHSWCALALPLGGRAVDAVLTVGGFGGKDPNQGLATFGTSQI